MSDLAISASTVCQFQDAISLFHLDYYFNRPKSGLNFGSFSKEMMNQSHAFDKLKVNYANNDEVLLDILSRGSIPLSKFLILDFSMIISNDNDAFRKLKIFLINSSLFLNYLKF
jgi:hypothetical protein